jgi:hypothetical protein
MTCTVVRNVEEKMQIDISNFQIFKCVNTKATAEAIGHVDLEASVRKALAVTIPQHNQNHDVWARSMSSYLEQCNLNHMLTNDKCFMLVALARWHNAPPTEDERLIRQEHLGEYEIGVFCKVVTRGGYDDEANYVPRGVDYVRHMEFIFDCSRMYQPDSKFDFKFYGPEKTCNVM